MFQFSAFASVLRTDDGIASAGLPHSDIRGSMGICPSPRLFAACHVLLRLREPRHPPYALVRLRYAFFKPTARAFRPAFKPYLIPWSASISRCSLSVFSLLRFYPRQRSTHVSLPVCQCPLSLMSGASEITPLSAVESIPFLSVENNGFEPLTPCLQSRCSSQLS